MPAFHKPALFLTALSIALVLLFTLFNGQAFAVHECKDITDLDEQNDCLQQEYESTSKKLSDVREQKSNVTQKINDLLGKLNVTEAELTDVQNDINHMVATLDTINQNLADKNVQLAEKIKFRNRVIRSFTKRGILNELETFLVTKEALSLSGFQYSTLSYMFEKSLNHEAVKVIKIVNSEIENYEQDKAEAEQLKTELVQAQASLLAAKSQIEADKTAAEGNLDVLAEQESSYEQKLSDISSKQQEILAAKAGSGNGTVGDYDAPGWKVPDPPFSPAFGFFSYGAYTHRRGMSQYGAKARAEAGQSYKDIVKFYYKEEPTEKDDFPDEICVQGEGDMDFQTYLYGLAEMPSSWDEEALKAQAVAARSYAYRYVKAGNCICTTTSCQVFSKDKSNNPPDSWRAAVDATEDVIISGDTGAFGYGWYSSTAGGYIENVGWDVNGSWPGGAYEKKADSPWFYWAWYSETYRFDSDTCGRSHPWLDEEEMADILNSWVVWKKGSGSDRDHISPVTTSCWGGDPWSHDEMADKAGDLDGEFTSVGSAKATVGNNGTTLSIAFGTNRGSVTIDGNEFATVFNLRAPGYVAIRYNAQTNVPLIYDVQRK